MFANTLKKCVFEHKSYFEQKNKNKKDQPRKAFTI